MVAVLRGLREWFHERVNKGEEAVQVWFRVKDGGGEREEDLGGGSLRRWELKEERSSEIVEVFES